MKRANACVQAAMRKLPRAPTWIDPQPLQAAKPNLCPSRCTWREPEAHLTNPTTESTICLSPLQAGLEFLAMQFSEQHPAIDKEQ